MIDAASPKHALLQFEGPVQAEAAHGAVSLVLRGRAQGIPTQLLFEGVGAAPLPPSLHDVRVTQWRQAEGLLRWELAWAEQRLELQGRAVQLHRDVSRPFFAALPPEPVPARMRLGWTFLLAALRLPGVARWVIKLRGST